MSDIDLAINAPLSFQFKSGAATLTSIQLLSDDLDLFHNQLLAKINQAPKFFKDAPVILDGQKLNSSSVIDFDKLRFILNETSLVPVGIRGCSESLSNAASNAGFAILSDTLATTTSPSKTPVPPTPFHASNKIVTTPVRSGQQIYARGGDLIVLAPVGHGAELLADGNIHVYGPLRGRALAGISGDKNVRVFCQCLEAELVSIAGQYRVSEDLKEGLWKVSVQIYLSGDHLLVKSL